MDSRQKYFFEACKTAKAAFFEDISSGRVWSNAIYPIVNESGIVDHVVLFGRDITDTKKAQTDIQEAEFKYRTVANNTYDWEFWTNPEGGSIYISPSCERITGYAIKDFEDNPKLMLNIIHPDDRHIFLHHLDKELFSDSSHDITFRINCKDRSVKWIEHVCQPVFNESGEYLGRRGSNRDVSIRKHFEEALEESEKRLNLALQVGKTGYWDWDVNTGRVNWYGESASLFGIMDEDFKGTIDAVQDLVHPDDRLMGMEALRRTLEGEIPYENTYRVVHSNGEIRWLYSYGHLQHDDHGRTVHIFGITQDITRYKLAEEELKRHAVELKEANTALRVLMKQREEDLKILEERIQKNVNELVLPYVKKLASVNLDGIHKEYLKILETNLNEITSSFITNLSTIYKRLTPQEIQVADLIKKGKNTKEMASMLRTSVHTVGTHRNNIRKKLGLRFSKVNLRSILLSYK
jgi:PAS domain S-box-containing protein